MFPPPPKAHVGGLRNICKACGKACGQGCSKGAAPRDTGFTAAGQAGKAGMAGGSGKAGGEGMGGSDGAAGAVSGGRRGEGAAASDTTVGLCGACVDRWEEGDYCPVCNTAPGEMPTPCPPACNPVLQPTTPSSSMQRS